MASRPRISVVMPAYNAEKTIANAINSILNQTIDDWELIIVDDGSTDNTLYGQIAKFTDPRIQCINIAHSGLVEARNEGNSHAKADVIAVQDADDLSMPDRLEKCLTILERGADVVYHGGYINMWDTQYDCIGRKYIPAESFDLERLKEGQYITGWPVFKKKVWEKNPYRKETQYMYDWAQYIDWVYNGAILFGLDEGLYEYVRHKNSASITFEKDGSRARSEAAIRRIIKEYEAKS